MLQEDVRKWFPSDDGNEAQRMAFLKWIEQILTGTDHLKDPDRVYLKGNKDRSGNFYGDLIQTSEIPQASVPMEKVTEKLLELLHATPYHNKYYFTNILPMASIPGVIGALAAFMTNGNNLWDVWSPGGAEAEVRVVAMMSRLVGYDSEKSGGYTTWGGQGAVFSGLRLAIAKQQPDALRAGVPRNFYAFCSEAAHFSLFKAMEATGIGTDNLIRVRMNPDSSMDIDDLQEKMTNVIREGGIPIYIVATTGTTDAMGIDDVEGISKLAQKLSATYGIRKPYIHADSAFGGFFAFFNNYDFATNPLDIDVDTCVSLRNIQAKIRNLHLADSLCFDFHKLGHAPYITSLFVVKEASDLKLVDLDPGETPYVGHRGYGQYHTGYTLECSRMSSSFTIYSSLLAFGIEGYQRILAQFVQVNIAFRKALMQQITEATVVNLDNPGIVTLFRIYEGSPRFSEEINGKCTQDEIEQTNMLNERLFERLGLQREHIFFGDTKKHLSVPTVDHYRMPLYASKFFVISPYTQPEHVDEIVSYLKTMIVDVLHNRPVEV